MKEKTPLLQLKNINMFFQKPGTILKESNIHVLRDISLDIYEGEIIALIGESGCGKTTLGKIITGLHKPTKGEIYFEGKKVSGLFAKGISSFESVQFIQQDSYAALNPVRTIYQSLYAPIKNKHKKWSRSQVDEKIEELMKIIGLHPSEQYLQKYPHQLSGGQRQRILMARAISLEPKLIVADEPVSMIDVSLRISLLNLMKKFNKLYNMSFVYVSHDLSTSRYFADNGRVAVMYLGEIVELGEIGKVIASPKHPYTRALIKAVPVPDPEYKDDSELPLRSMTLGSLENRKEGCSFYERCPYAEEKCLKRQSHEVYDGAEVLCHKVREIDEINKK